MENEDTFSPKIFALEVAIYGLFAVIYIYLVSVIPKNWAGRLFSHMQFFQPVDWPVVIVLALLALAVVLFATESLSVDIITLILLVGLVAGGILTPAEAFAGFSNDIIIILASIFVISAALQQTGVLDAIGVYLFKAAGHSSSRLKLLLMGSVGGLSMFINNTTATAVFIPPTLGVARRAGLSASKLLMPLAYASILGGTCTLIGTSTNVAVSGYMAQLGLAPLGLFELMPVGLIILGVGTLYLLGVSDRLLPGYANENLTDNYNMREYLSEVVVRPESDLIGQRIFESDLSRLDFEILAVWRGERQFRPNIRSKIEAGDMLLVRGKVTDLMQVKETAGIEIKPDFKWADSEWRENDDSDPFKLAELLIIPQSDLIGRTLKSSHFLQTYGAAVLAIYRHGHSLRDRLGRIRLRLGDLLLVQGSTERLELLRRNPNFWVLEELNPLMFKKRKGLLAVAFLIAAVVAGGAGWLPMSIAFLGAAVLVVLFGCITIEEIYELMDWRLLILIGGMTTFGVAMEKTGAAQLLANGVVYLLEPLGVMAVLAGFFIMTILLTQPMSNAAAALVVLPVALHAAQNLGVNERTFAIAIMLAASISLITPFEPSCLLVYGPGKYKFIDFVKIGSGLTLLLMLVTLLAMPMLWPF